MADTTTNPATQPRHDLAEHFAALADGTLYHLQSRQLFHNTFFEAFWWHLLDNLGHVDLGKSYFERI